MPQPTATPPRPAPAGERPSRAAAARGRPRTAGSAGRLGGVAAAAVVALVLAACGGGTPARRATSSGPSVAERRAVHDGLDRIGRACSRRSLAARRAAAREVPRLLALARRYPRQRFTLEPGGESGTALGVLLVARAELLRCAPAAARAIDAALPPGVRRALPPPPRRSGVSR